MNRADESSSFRDFCRTSQFYFALLKYAITLPFQRKIELHDPQQVLREKLGDDLEVLDFKTDKFVKFGDNYGSSIVKASIDVKRGDRLEKLHLVAKMLPPGGFVRKHIQCDVFMTKEIFFYEEIVPAYQKLCDGDFDIAPMFYGGRLAVKPDATDVDDNAVLLMENLKERGYVMEDRLKGLTLDHLRIVVPTIAKFHAIGLAMKQRNPDFYSKIKNYAKPFELPPQMVNMLMSKINKIIKNNRELSVYHERVKSLMRFDSNGNYVFFEEFDDDNPWLCLVHRDLWINNMMFRKDGDKLDGFKFIDFQLYGISSPMTDLMYFLFTSLPQEFKDFDEAVKLYRTSVCDELKKLDCDASLFEEESFAKRLKEDAKHELSRCLVMARNIEVRSGWDMMRVSADTIQRMKQILKIYDLKGWFDS